MLPHAILLLLGSLAIADAADPPCHKNYVVRPAGFGISFLPGDTIVDFMGCPGASATPILKYNGGFYKKMTCTTAAGWAADGVPLTLTATTRFTVECVAAACHKLMISGFNPAKMTYLSNELRCSAQDESIEYTDNSVTKLSALKCDTISHFWMDKDNVATSFRDTDRITVACVKTACHLSLISGFDPTKMAYDNNKKLTCTTAPETLMKYTKSSIDKFTSTLTCVDAANGVWKDDNAVTTIGNEDTIPVECVENACHESLVTVTHPASRTTNQITCPSTDEIQIGIESGKYTDLRCDKANGWQDGGMGAPVKPADDQFDVKCVAKAPPTCTSFTLSPGMAFSMKTLTCNTPHHALQKNAIGLFYASMKCDENNGWTSPVGGFTDGDALNLPADVTCEDYCKRTESGVVVEVTDVPTVFTATCRVTTEVLYYKNARVNGADLTCSMNSAWAIAGVPLTSADPFECRKACESFTPATDLSKIDRNTPNIFKCTERLKGIKLGDNYVFSNLYCDETTGWIDVDKKQLAGAFDQVTLSCDSIPCGQGISTCNAFEQSKFEKVAEYFCGPTGETSPSELTDDPYFQRCRETQKIFNYESNQFYEKAPRCRADRTWFLHDDSKNEDMTVDDTKLVCLRKRCNMCGTLAVTDVPGDTVTLILGTADDCATATCPGNLWNIRREGKAASEQYAGEVTCSSDNVAPKAGKWLIDGETPIDQASCIPEASRDVKCSIAAELDFNCLVAWPFGCMQDEQISEPPSDDNNVDCPNGKKMFYKQKGEHGFEEDGLKIKCDKTNGVWIVTKSVGEPVQLKRKGTVICADANPQPTTTTQAPTTTTLLVNACDLCPNITSVLRTCETCSTKSTDLQLSTAQLSDGEDVCTAKPYGDKKIETEKAGPVKELQCKKADKTWLTTDGKEPGKFAAYQDGPPKDDGNLPYIVAGLVGGVLFLLIVFVVIFKVFVAKKKPEDKDEETRRKMLEEGKKKKKQKAGDNDEILDDVVVDAPSELKL